ncbi:MAG: KEOPS complex subunit Pcc1 [Candidatus Nezhaarchaeota archaeon]|nr:KEOPS complex subunit Pcc1 [Candidatus Nezhaarchaeota archaeon]
MKLRVEVRLRLNSPDLAASAARAIEVDNRQSPKDIVVACEARDNELTISIACEKPLRTLSTIEDLFTCLAPLIRLKDLL